MTSVVFAVEVITLAPQVWPVVLGAPSGLVGRAFDEERVSLRVRNLRDYGKGVHQQVDDAPFGGGPGMVLGVEPLHRAISDARAQTAGPVILLTPRGEPLQQQRVRELATGPGMILVCGRFEGVDERVRRYVDLQISIGDFVLSAGDPAAWCLIDAVVRQIPGVLGNTASLAEESFAGDVLEYPQYTRPVVYDGVAVPDVLLSGHHANIAAWRRAQAAMLTGEHRPDLAERQRKNMKSP